MTCANKTLLVVMVVATLGLWGCSQNQSNPGVGSARLRDLESRYAKLEEDYRSAVSARDQARKKQTTLQEQNTQLVQQVEQLLAVVKDRDELRKQVNQRTTERDSFQAQLVQFGRELQNLVGKIDAAAGTNVTPPPVTSAATVGTQEKS